MSSQEQFISTTQFGDIVLGYSKMNVVNPRSIADDDSTGPLESSSSIFGAIKRILLPCAEALTGNGYRLVDPFQEVRVAAKITAAGAKSVWDCS